MNENKNQMSLFKLLTFLIYYILSPHVNQGCSECAGRVNVRNDAPTPLAHRVPRTTSKQLVQDKESKSALCARGLIASSLWMR